MRLASNGRHEKLSPQDYAALAELRYQVRRFLNFSERAARAQGLEPRQHQLMLALKGLPAGSPPRIVTLAERLQIRHNSAVELVNRLVARGLLQRQRSGADRREVLLKLTAPGQRMLRDLSLHHKDELNRLGPSLVASLRRVMQSGAQRGRPSAPNRGSRNGR